MRLIQTNEQEDAPTFIIQKL